MQALLFLHLFMRVLHFLAKKTCTFGRIKLTQKVCRKVSTMLSVTGYGLLQNAEPL